MILTVFQIIILNLIGLVLGYASLQDLKYRIIGKWEVVYLFLLAICFIISRGETETYEVTSTFLVVLTVFVVFSLISRGGFGIGDAFVISAVVWVIACFGHIANFFYALGITSLVWATFWVLYLYQKNGHGHFIDSFRQKQIINVNKLEPGMVLEGDNFMHGLTEQDIAKLKNNGLSVVTVKQPLPYIPVIFMAYLIYFLI